MTNNSELAAVRAAQREVVTMQTTIAQLRKENRYLRNMLADNSRSGRLLRRAYDDAKTMLVWRYSGIYPSRRWCLENGIAERRWSWARAFMMAARVHDGNDIVEGDFAALERQLSVTYNRLRNGDDDTLIALRMRMPRKFRRLEG